MLKYHENFAEIPGYAPGQPYVTDPDARARGVLVIDPQEERLALTHNSAKQPACIKLQAVNRQPRIDLSKYNGGQVRVRGVFRCAGTGEGRLLEIPVQVSAYGQDRLVVARGPSGVSAFFAPPLHLQQGEPAYTPLPADTKPHEVEVVLRNNAVMLRLDNAYPVRLVYTVAASALPHQQTVEAWLMSSAAFPVYWYEYEAVLKNMTEEVQP